MWLENSIAVSENNILLEEFQMSRKENISASIILESLNDASSSDDELYTSLSQFYLWLELKFSKIKSPLL